MLDSPPAVAAASTPLPDEPAPTTPKNPPWLWEDPNDIHHRPLRWKHHVLVGLTGLFFLLWFIPYYEDLPGAKASLDSPNEKTRVLNMASIGLYRELHINRVRANWWCRQTDLAGRKRKPSDGPDAPSLLVYPGKTPGMALMLGPFYGLYKKVFSTSPPSLFEATYFARFFGTLMPSWLISLVFYAFLLLICRTRYVILTGYFTFLLGSMTYPYTLTVSSHAFSSGLLFLVFLLLAMCPRATGKRAILSLLSGVCLGLAIAAEYSAVFTGVFLAIIGLWHRPPLPQKYASQPPPTGWRGFFFFWQVRWHLWLILLGSIPPVLAVFWYHKIAFGSILSTPYSHLLHEPFRIANAQGVIFRSFEYKQLANAFLTPSYGLFFWTPFLLFCIPAIVMLWRRRNTRFYAIWLAGFFAWWAFYNATQFNPRGGWTVGPRYIANLIPFGFAAAIWAADLLYRRLGNRIAIVIAFSAIWSILFYVPTSAYFPHLPDHSNMPLIEITMTMLRRGLTPINLLGLPPFWSTLIFFFALFALCAYIAWSGLIGPFKKRALALLLFSLLFGYLILFQIYPIDYNYRELRFDYIEKLIPNTYRWNSPG